MVHHKIAFLLDIFIRERKLFKSNQCVKSRSDSNHAQRGPKTQAFRLRGTPKRHFGATAAAWGQTEKDSWLRSCLLPFIFSLYVVTALAGKWDIRSAIYEEPFL